MLKRVAAAVRQKNNFLITTHINLEGDALGSTLAFYRLVKALGKRAAIIIDDDLPQEYKFLPGTNKIKKFNRQYAKSVKFDCLVALDCSDLKRSGGLCDINLTGKAVINIDHHISNSRFAGLNWVDPGASCACEMVYRLYKYLHIPIDEDIALSLYTGILTDTGSFQYSNTTSFTHQVASQLLKYNLDPAGIYKNVYKNIPFEDIKLLNRVLTAIRRDNSGKIAWFCLGQRLILHKAPFDWAEYLLSFARAIKGVEVVALFKENLKAQGEIRVNLRSHGKIDVNKIAQIFGGGGHKTASACTVKGSLKKVTKEVLDKIRGGLK